jgi:hypothetical protein
MLLTNWPQRRGDIAARIMTGNIQDVAWMNELKTAFPTPMTTGLAIAVSGLPGNNEARLDRSRKAAP